jgi:hypothetical protein
VSTFPEYLAAGSAARMTGVDATDRDAFSAFFAEPHNFPCAPQVPQETPS